MNRYILLAFALAACVGDKEAKDGEVDGGAGQPNCSEDCFWGTGNPCFGLSVVCNYLSGANRCWIENNGCVVDPETCAESCTGVCGTKNVTGDCVP